ncbi:putative ABC transporter ATP-binding protein [Janibacter sp. HTCC2649]|uniref:ABC transporter ATP-binding protein n=1 Tax=Janibacter sp. HTCC2649 TaxID=313589 RepID=UPI000067182C|nr:ABC transporter ATP-binding protein [Janibacter sp. HTCC2649]EAP98503.1 putative ABC transporter ATP-binding protein [Janibacter sp. HTCC2649]
MNRSTAVRARGLTKKFGDVVALDALDLDVEPGQIHGLVGPNGAGKTTLLGLLLGLAVADSGSLEVLGTPVGPVLSTPDGVAGFVDGPGLYPSLTARQNLSSVVSLRGQRHRGDDVDEALVRVGLDDVADDAVRGFSLGMRQRLGLAAALLSEPRLLILDEPANGLDPAGKRQVHRVLTDFAEAGATVILSSHRMDDLAALCTDVTLLSTGRMVFSGAPQKLAVEGGLLDYRILTPDGDGARRVAEATPGVRIVHTRDTLGLADTSGLVVRGHESAVDALVVGLVGAGIAIRELAPTIPPLEAAFLALTGADTQSYFPERLGQPDPLEAAPVKELVR